MEQLQLDLTDDDAKRITNKIKQLADIKALTLDQVDVLLRKYHSAKVTNSSHLVVLEDLVHHEQLATVVEASA
jgi:homocitrate synthase